METAVEPARPRAAPSGARSGALIAAASVVATGLNYVFLLAAGRVLGSDDYGALAALLGLLTLVLLPTGAVQLAVSREVSRRLASGDDQGADAFAWAALRLGLIATGPLVALGLVLVLPLRELLNIESTSAVALAMAGLVAAVALPVAMGVLQGFQRFHAIGSLYVLPFALRLVLLALVASLGYQLGGAMLAAVAGGIATAVASIWLLREPLRRRARASRPALGPFFRYLWPVLVGLIGIAVLTNVDILVVKARFSPDDAGEYAAASAFARIAFFLPATILAVLFPRTAARQARGEDTEDILGRSLLVTAAFCSLLTIFYAMTGRGLVHTSFGSEFAEGGELLVPFTVSMALFALANVLVGFHLSRGETRYAWIVSGAALVQVPILAVVPSTPRAVIWVDIAIGIALIVSHELAVRSSIPALRAGWLHLLGGIQIARRVVFEAGLVLLGAAALVCVLTWPLVTELGSAFFGSEGSDASATVSWLWRLQEEGYHLFGSTTHELTGAPFGWVEGNGLNLQWLFPYYGTYLVAQLTGEVVAFNLTVLAGYVLSGAAMYVLARYLGCNALVSAWAGLVFVAFPWHLERAEHASLLHLEVLVLVVLALVVAVERQTWLRLSLVAAAVLLCWLTSGYFGAMGAIGAAAFALVAATVLPSWTARRRLVIGVLAGTVMVSGLFAVAATSAGVVGREAGLDREVADLSALGLRASELVLPTADSIVFGDLFAGYHEDRLHGSNPTETANYLGLLTIGFAIAWVVVAWRRRGSLGPRLRTATAGLLGIAVASILFAAPSPLPVFGIEWEWTPSRLLWELLPPFRVISRWTPMLMTAILPLAALGLQTSWTALVRRGRRTTATRLAPVALVFAAMLVSLLELTVHPAAGMFRLHPEPPQYAAVMRVEDGILAEYPLSRSDIYLLWQREHARRLLNGGATGTFADDVRRSLLDPRPPGTPETLALLGVTAIVARPNALEFEAGMASPALPNARLGRGYALVERFSDGSSVWRVTAPPAPALAVLPGSDFALPVFRSGVIAHPLIANPGQIGFWALTSAVVRMRFDARSADGVARTLRLTGAEGETTISIANWTAISVVLRVPRGHSSLNLMFEPAPSETAVELTAPRIAQATGPAGLRSIPNPEAVTER